MSRNLLALSFCLLLTIAVVLGCSTASREFVRAQRLELSGRNEEALKTYQALETRLGHDPRRRSQVYYRMGECLMRLDRVPDAFSAFEKAAATDSNNEEAQLRVGEFLLAAGATQRALETADAVMARRPSSEALALRGAALAASGQTEKAKDAYRHVLEIDPRRVSVAIALADLYNREDQVGEAKQVLRTAAARSPDSPGPLLALARLHEQEGELGDAEKTYRQAVTVSDTPETNLKLAQFLQRTARISEAEQVLRRVDAQRPGQPTALPDFELLAGRTTSALDSYEAALSSKLEQSRGGASPGANAELVRERAKLATRVVEADLEVATGRQEAERSALIQRARAHLDENRVDLDPATIVILQAEIALAARDLPRAGAEAARAVSLAPQSAPAHYVAGSVKAAGDDAAGARAEWIAALESDDRFAPARLALGEQALRGGDAKAAERYVVPVVRDEPGNLRALNLFARVLLAQKRYAAAELIAKRGQAVDVSAPEPHLILGQIALEQGEPAGALLQFEHAALLDAHSKEAIEGLTKVYRTGRVTRPMLARIERVAQASPVSPTLMEIAGRLYAEHGWFTDAKRCLEQALRMDPGRNTAATELARTFAATGNLKAAADSASRTEGKSAAVLAGVRAQERNDTSAAIAHYEQAVREGDRTGVAANNLAWLYAQSGTNLDRALQLAESAWQMAPENAAVLDTVGLVRLRLRKYTDAIRALEEARRLAGRNMADPVLVAQINQHLAEAYLRVGKTQAAEALARGDEGSQR
jgi:tetratricopeptide (TPR) repeat protein